MNSDGLPSHPSEVESSRRPAQAASDRPVPAEESHQLGQSTTFAIGPASTVTNREYYPNFDWLRLAFATQVVAIHADVAPHVLVPAVPAFLAVSGFVVMGSIERLSTLSFFANRALRVLPLLFATFVFIYLRYGSDELILTVKFWLWPFQPAEPINAVVWTLMYEELFYVVLAVLFAIDFYRSVLFPVIVWVGFTSLLMSQIFLGLDPPFFLLGASFFLGNVVYLLRGSIARVNPWVSVALLVAASLLMWRLPYTAVVFPPHTIETFVSIAAVLVFGVAGPRLPKLPFDFSYSLYLVHCLVRQELFGIVPMGMPMFGVMLLVSLPICAMAWFLIERPALGLKRRRSRHLVSRAVPASTTPSI
jgi:peptidoglycan/LPS O-acetylase OafA/YrhL